MRSYPDQYEKLIGIDILDLCMMEIGLALRFGFTQLTETGYKMKAHTLQEKFQRGPSVYV